MAAKKQPKKDTKEFNTYGAAIKEAKKRGEKSITFNLKRKKK